MNLHEAIIAQITEATDTGATLKKAVSDFIMGIITAEDLGRRVKHVLDGFADDILDDLEDDAENNEHEIELTRVFLQNGSIKVEI